MAALRRRRIAPRRPSRPRRAPRRPRMRVRRTRHAFFYVEDDYLVDVEAILRGELPPPAPQCAIIALAVLTRTQHRLEAEQFQRLLSVPADRWTDADRLDADIVSDLTQHGL